MDSARRATRGMLLRARLLRSRFDAGERIIVNDVKSREERRGSQLASGAGREARSAGVRFIGIERFEVRPDDFVRLELGKDCG